jgi:hypothetical protein
MDDAVGDTELCVTFLPCCLVLSTVDCDHCNAVLYVMFTGFSSCQSTELKSSECQYDVLFNDEFIFLSCEVVFCMLRIILGSFSRHFEFCAVRRTTVGYTWQMVLCH